MQTKTSIYLNCAIIKKSSFLRKILCSLNIHFSGFVAYGAFLCPYCGKVLHVHNQEYLQEVMNREKEYPR